MPSIAETVRSAINVQLNVSQGGDLGHAATAVIDAVIAAVEARLVAIEAKQTQLEARVAALENPPPP